MRPSGLNVGAFGFQTQEEHPMMARVPASEQTRKRIAEVLRCDLDKGALLRDAVRLIVEEALEAEVTDVRAGLPRAR